PTPPAASRPRCTPLRCHLPPQVDPGGRCTTRCATDSAATPCDKGVLVSKSTYPAGEMGSVCGELYGRSRLSATRTARYTLGKFAITPTGACRENRPSDRHAHRRAGPA